MLLISILLLLLSNAVTLRRDTSILFNRIAILCLTYCILHLITMFIYTPGISLHGGLLYIAGLVQIFHLFIFIVSILILQLTSFYNITVLVPDRLLFRRKIIKKAGGIIEYPLLLLFVISGGVFLMSSFDLISIFLSIELQSYGLYLLSIIYKHAEVSNIGGLVYFLLGGVSSCFILFGICLLYAYLGTTSLEGLYLISSINENMTYLYKSSYFIKFALLILSVGFLFKVSAAPFHFWSPVVYDSMPTIVTTFVAIVGKISILGFLLEFWYYTGLGGSWWLLMSSFLSLLFGTYGGLLQFRIKRLFAYSTISQLGFILLALSVSSLESREVCVFYIIQYSICNLNAFFILIIMGSILNFYRNKNKENNKILDLNNSPIQFIIQLKGYYDINPMLSICLAITFFSFAGMPPLVGFWAKLMVLRVAFNKGYWVLCVIAIFISIIGVVYYLRVLKLIFLLRSDYFIDSQLIDVTTELEPKNKNYCVVKGQGVKKKISEITYLARGGDYTKNLYPEKKQIRGHIMISNNMAITISIITIQIVLFIFMGDDVLCMSAILAQSFIYI